MAQGTNYDIQNVGIASEGSTYGAIVSSTKLPPTDYSGITYLRLPLRRGSWYETDEPLVDTGAVAGGLHGVAPFATGYINRTGGAAWGAADGTRIRRLMGQIPIEWYPWTIGTADAFASYGAMPWALLLDSCMGVIQPGNASGSYGADTINTGSSSTVFTVTTVADLEEGMVLGFEINGAREYGRIAKIATSTVTLCQALSGTPSNGSTYYKCRTYYPRKGIPNTSFTMDFNLDDTYRRSAFGCRLGSLKGSWQDDALLFGGNVETGVVLTNDSAADSDPEWTAPDGALIQRTQAYNTISGAIGGNTVGAPALTRTEVDLFDYEFDINFNMSRSAGKSESIIGYSNMVIGRPELTLTLRHERNATFHDMARKREHRLISLGWGPTGAGYAGCLMVNAAYVKTGTKTADRDKRPADTTVFGAGPWAYDNTASHAGSNVPWCIAFAEGV